MVQTFIYFMQLTEGHDDPFTFFHFSDGFDFSDGWKKHLEESDKKARVILESYYKKCQENNVSDSCGIQ